MTNHAITAAACAALGLLIAEPAAAACSLAAQPIPLKIVAQRPMVTVKVNGKAANFLLDSGSAVNQISSKFAASLKLAPTTAGGPPVVTAPQVEFAGSQLKNVPLVVSELPDDVDGVVGQTVLRQGDVEYDLGAFDPKSGPAPSVKLFKATGCEGVNMAYWAKDGDSYSEMPLEPMDKDAPFTKSEVTINGVKLRAMLMSGVPYTMITEKAAAKAGVKTTDAGVKAFKSGGSTVWIGTFSTVKIGDEEVKNAPLEIGQTNDDFYDVLIGEDWLAQHHLYVANSQQKIYFTYAPPPAPPGAPKMPPAPVFQAHVPKPIGAGMSTRAESRGRLTDHYQPSRF